jgi:hypothetical protein
MSNFGIVLVVAYLFIFTHNQKFDLIYAPCRDRARFQLWMLTAIFCGKEPCPVEIYDMMSFLIIYSILYSTHAQCFGSALTFWGSGSSFLGECGSSFKNECWCKRIRIQLRPVRPAKKYCKNKLFVFFMKRKSHLNIFIPIKLVLYFLWLIICLLAAFSLHFSSFKTTLIRAECGSHADPHPKHCLRHYPSHICTYKKFAFNFKKRVTGCNVTWLA